LLQFIQYLVKLSKIWKILQKIALENGFMLQSSNIFLKRGFQNRYTMINHVLILVSRPNIKYISGWR
jgi:hypothetical protein